MQSNSHGIPGHITIEPHIREIYSQASGDNEQAGPGHDIRVTIIQGGTSKNGFVYDDAALRSIAQMVEGARAYADHSGGNEATRSVRDIVGFYQDATFVAGEGKQVASVEATLHLFESAEWLWSIIQEANTLGRSELIGLSIDIFGQWQRNEAEQTRTVTRVVSLNSCDIVTRPSAGGAFRRILHDEQADMDHSQVVDAFLSKGTIMQQEPIQEQQAITEQQSMPAVSEMQKLINELRVQQAELLLERRLQESILPGAVKAPIHARFQGRIFEESELERELSGAMDMMAQLTRDGMIRDHGYEKSSVSGMISEAEKIQAAFDSLFDLEIDTARLGNIRPFESLREAYTRVTGDAAISGSMNSSLLGNIRVSEHAPIARISEADITTASFSYLLGSSMNKRLLRDYQAWPSEWMKFCTIVPIRDFRQQSRVRMGSFGSLPTVAEDTPYGTMTTQDTAAVYVPAKRGTLVPVSRETIINDDLQAIKQIPTKLAIAAAYTLAEFVYGFLSSNALIFDGSALFTSSAPHNNFGAAALSSTSLQAGVTAMRKQTNLAGKPIGLRPRFLIVPPDLEFTAMVMTRSAGVPGSPNNDINALLGYVTPIVSPQLTSTTQWFLAADPRTVDTIEIGFVGGQTNPVLLIQDAATVGLAFSQDVISFKCRFEFGGVINDFRGLYRGI